MTDHALQSRAMPPRGGRREGAGRKSKFGDEATCQVNLRLPVQLAEELRARAADTGRTAAEIVAQALRRELRKRKPTGDSTP